MLPATLFLSYFSVYSENNKLMKRLVGLRPILVLLATGYASQANFMDAASPVARQEADLLLYPAQASSLPTTLAAYISLTKPRIIGLLLVTTLAAMVLAQGAFPPWPLVGLTLLGGALMAGAANALNCYLDRDLDAKMSRTRNRPLVTGRLTSPQALLFGLALALSACFILVIGVNALSALLAFGGLLIYVLLYTRWKRRSPASVLIGGVAGALPPLVGWTAVNNALSVNALLLFAIMVVWQVPHTLALSLLLRADYTRANVPVLPVVHGITHTQREIVVYTAVLFALTLVPYVLGFEGQLYAIGVVVLGGWFIIQGVKGLRPSNGRDERRLYKFSLLYLLLLFMLMIVGRVG